MTTLASLGLLETAALLARPRRKLPRKKKSPMVTMSTCFEGIEATGRKNLFNLARGRQGQENGKIGSVQTPFDRFRTAS